MDLPGPFATWFRRGSADAQRRRSVCGTAIQDSKLEAHSDEWFNCAIPEARRPARREDANPAGRRMLAYARFVRRSCPGHRSSPSKSRMHMKCASGNRSQPKGRSLLHVRISLGSIAVLQIQKLYFVENWIVLAGPAALALPKSGELTTPMMLVTFV